MNNNIFVRNGANGFYYNHFLKMRRFCARGGTTVFTTCMSQKRAGWQLISIIIIIQEKKSMLFAFGSFTLFPKSRRRIRRRPETGAYRPGEETQPWIVRAVGTSLEREGAVSEEAAEEGLLLDEVSDPSLDALVDAVRARFLHPTTELQSLLRCGTFVTERLLRGADQRGPQRSFPLCPTTTATDEIGTAPLETASALPEWEEQWTQHVARLYTERLLEDILSELKKGLAPTETATP